jgi:hypothetical protein
VVRARECRNNARSSGQQRWEETKDWIGSIYTLPMLWNVGCMCWTGWDWCTALPNLVHGIPIDADRLRCGQRGGDARYRYWKQQGLVTCSACGLVPQSMVQYSRSVTGFPVVGRSSTLQQALARKTPRTPNRFCLSVSCWRRQL